MSEKAPAADQPADVLDKLHGLSVLVGSGHRWHWDGDSFLAREEERALPLPMGLLHLENKASSGRRLQLRSEDVAAFLRQFSEVMDMFNNWQKLAVIKALNALTPGLMCRNFETKWLAGELLLCLEHGRYDCCEEGQLNRERGVWLEFWGAEWATSLEVSLEQIRTRLTAFRLLKKALPASVLDLLARKSNTLIREDPYQFYLHVHDVSAVYEFFFDKPPAALVTRLTLSQLTSSFSHVPALVDLVIDYTWLG